MIVKIWKKISQPLKKKKGKKVPIEPLVPIRSDAILLKTSLKRTIHGRIVSEENDVNPTVEDYRLFIDIAKLFEHNTYQVTKITYILNEKIEKSYLETLMNFSRQGIPTKQVLVFHGTNINNIPTIIENGFKVGGQDGHPQTHGALYGTGIYTSQTGLTPLCFCSDTCMVACIGILGYEDIHHKKVKKFPDWFIFSTPEQLLPCYVIYFSNKLYYPPLLPLPQQYGYRETLSLPVPSTVTDMPSSTELPSTTEMPSTTELPANETLSVKQDDDMKAVDFLCSQMNPMNNDDESTTQMLSSQTTKILQKQLRNVLKIQMNTTVTERGWTLLTDNFDKINVWEVMLTHFDENLKLTKDMKRKDVKGVHLQVIFPDNYPTHPPFVRIVYPRMLRYLNGGGGHVTAGGAICVELLTTSAWDSTYQMDGIFQVVHMLLSTKDPPARLDKNYKQSYTLKEAKESFERVAKDHRWIQ